MAPRSSRPSFSSFDHPNPSRLHSLLVMLQSGEAIHAGQAASVLDVSRRTIARDLKFLREHIGLSVGFDPATRSYQLVSGEATPEDDASRSTLAAFVIARHALAALGTNTADRDLMEAATERLVAALPPTLRVEHPVVTESSPETLSFDQIVLLHRAIEQRSRVAVHRPSGDSCTIVPRALLSRQGRWWAVAEGDEDPAAFRFVPIERTVELEDLGPATSTPPPLDLDALIASHPIICESPGHTAYRIALSAETADRCAQTLPPFQHRLVETEAGADLYVCAASAADVAPWCLGLGDGFSAEHPDLRRAIVRAAEDIAARHRE